MSIDVAINALLGVVLLAAAEPRSADGTAEHLPRGTDVRVFGAKGDGVSDDTAAINAAIRAGPGTVFLPPGVYRTSSAILLRDNVRLMGSGAGSYGRGGATARITTIKPLASFSGTSVIKLDAANNGSDCAYILGSSVSDLAIDGYEVRGAHTIGLELRSVTNAETFSNLRIINFDVGSYVFIGMSANRSALQADGITFDNLYTLSNSLTPLSSDPSLVIENANEIAFRDSKIQRSVYTAGNVGAHVRSTIIQTVNAVTFSGVTFTGVEDAVLVESVTGSPQGPRWVRLVNCSFEGVRNGLRVLGVATAPAQFNTFGPGNRMQTVAPGGAQVVLDNYAANNTVITDEYVGYGGDGSNKLVRLAARSTGNWVFAAPGSVADSGNSNVVLGRSGSALMTPQAFAIGNPQGSGSPTLELNAGTGSIPRIRLNRNGNTVASIQASSVHGDAELILIVGDKEYRITRSGHIVAPGGIVSGTSISGDRGDRDLTLVFGDDAQIQRFASPLTRDRKISLSTASAVAGATFRIVRTGLGTGTLDVGGLRTLSAATAGWVDVAFDGARWRLTGYGGL